MKPYIYILVGFKLWLVLVVATLFPPAASVDIGRSALAGEASPTPVLAEGKSRPTSEPYTGDLSIFEEAGRDEKLQIDRVMDLLGITAGKSVADIGAGSGWFTTRAAKRVGKGGQVFAVEINPDYVAHIDKRAAAEGLRNIKAILGKTEDPTLPANSVDAVLILKTYHEFAEPVAMMKKVRVAMKKGGLVGIIDRSGDGADHGLDEATVIKEMKLAGFELKNKHDFVKPDNMDYFLVFAIR